MNIYYQNISYWLSDKVLLSNFLRVPFILGGPHTQTLLRFYFRIYRERSTLKCSFVSSIALFWASYSDRRWPSRKRNRSLLLFFSRKRIWWRVILWMSSIRWNDPINSKLSFSKGFRFRMGSSRRMAAATFGSALRSRASLKSRSIRSQKGNKPVPPTTTMTLPSIKFCSYSPWPLSELSWRVLSFIFSKSLVNAPFLYCFISKLSSLPSSY